ncbi:ornithine decarboxylase [Pseudomonas sp. MAP12]|uniref:Ornithine decarboxylase n=1 Tax=Geopseudomonas aromaticivorans TaxID=2849492 RepID=A0ABS6N2V0_9GAMM|nr:ornithine decarboxylase [Pseudomonas aromaticivorans]MBV2135150.1 ornithine decarboxylase [Pseudomonas aromaticivorans]
MSTFKVACPPSLFDSFVLDYPLIDLTGTDFTNVAAAVATVEQAHDVLAKITHTGFPIPLFVALRPDETVPEDILSRIAGTLQVGKGERHFNGKRIAQAADTYAQKLYPPFFKALKEYVKTGNVAFDCPGHQGGQFFRGHPLGRAFFEFFGENVFRADLCNADVKLGDLLIHEGPARDAQMNAARIYNADKTYFVLNGTSTSNKVVTSALLAKDDLVLFDRNNHKSIHLGALILSGAKPVYLETARNCYGFIGGIDAHCFDEQYIRAAIAEVDPDKAQQERPIRLAVIQLGTYDGTIYDARQVVEKIGRLCDYILFDSAWVGYEQFIPMMHDSSPLLLELGPGDPGLFVTQSVHKQQAGFSQSSQIHKKDRHIKGQARYCNHKRLNNAYMMHASTSPFYPIFAALDVNAQMHDGLAGCNLWRECIKNGVEARKLMLRTCKYIKPFIPALVDGRPWAEHETEMIIDDLRFFKFRPEDKWHDFAGYARDQYYVDPCKMLLTTFGIDPTTGGYASLGVPAAVLAHYLRANGIVPEKADLNSILFLLTPSDNFAKLQHLVAHIAQFERHIDHDSPLREVLPAIDAAHEKYSGYTLRRLCLEMHDFYRRHEMNKLQKQMFRKQHFPRQAMTPWEANQHLLRNNVELVPLAEIDGRIAAEGALPYPPGVLCVVPGEVWGGAALKYFLALEEGVNALPGFEPEIQGVYLQREADGSKRAYGYVIKE